MRSAAPNPVHAGESANVEVTISAVSMGGRLQLAGLTPEQRDAVEAMTRGMMAKLLHDPTVRLKYAAGSSRGDRLAESARDLFDLS